MAYYTRKQGMDLWEKTTFYRYGFCLCCKQEVAEGDEGYQSIKQPKARKNFLCTPCVTQWLTSGNIPLYKITRFKL